MSDVSQGDGLWIAIDGKWYPPELRPDYVQPTSVGPNQPELEEASVLERSAPTQPMVPPSDILLPPSRQSSTAGWRRRPRTWIGIGIVAIALAAFGLTFAAGSGGTVVSTTPTTTSWSNLPGDANGENDDQYVTDLDTVVPNAAAEIGPGEAACMGLGSTNIAGAVKSIHGDGRSSLTVENIVRFAVKDICPMYQSKLNAYEKAHGPLGGAPSTPVPAPTESSAAQIQDETLSSLAGTDFSSVPFATLKQAANQVCTDLAQSGGASNVNASVTATETAAQDAYDTLSPISSSVTTDDAFNFVTSAGVAYCVQYAKVVGDWSKAGAPGSDGNPGFSISSPQAPTATSGTTPSAAVQTPASVPDPLPASDEGGSSYGTPPATTPSEAGPCFTDSGASVPCS